MSIKPGEVYRESGGAVMPGPKHDGWPLHLVKFHDGGGWSDLPSATPEGAIRFVYQNVRSTRDCLNPGLGPMVLHVEDMWTGTAESGRAYVFLKTEPTSAKPETIEDALTIGPQR